MFPLSTPTPASSSPPTLREIARHAGVSHTTVSLSLRNHPSIPQATRERLQRLADQLGYRSNLLVSALMSQVRLKHTNVTPEVVGFLTGGPTPEDWKKHSAMSGFYEGARRRGQQLGMRVEPFWLGPGGADASRACRMLHTRGIRGNLLAPFPTPVYAHELDWPRLICVALGYTYNQHALHRATHNHFRSTFRTFENLCQRGYKRIGLVLDRDENSRVNFGWLGGYLAAQLMANQVRLKPLLVARGEEAPALRRWMNRTRPDAVIGFGPHQYRMLTKLGYGIPDDIAFAALDVQQTLLAGIERVSGIDQNLQVIGATAVDVLAAQLYHNEQGLPSRPVFSMIDGFWVDGDTAPVRGLMCTT